MAGFLERVKAGNEALVERRNILREISAETERIVRAQGQGVQQVQAIAEVANQSLAIGRSQGGGGGGGSLQNLGASGVLGLLVGAVSSGGGGSGGGGPGFQAGAPSLRGASFARSLALGQFR